MGDISNWSRASVVYDDFMFSSSKMAKKLGIRTPSFEEVKSHFISLRLERDLQGILPEQSSPSKVRL